MSVKGAGTGHFQIPTAPVALTAVAQSAVANTLGAAVAFGNAPSAMYITGVTIGVATTQVPTYVEIQILVGGAIVTSVLVPYGVSSGVAASVLTGYRPIFPPIPVANGAAITVKSASSVASAVPWGVSLECIAQANVVDDGITVGTVNLVNTLTTYTGNTLQTGDAFARLGAPAGASVSVDVAAVKTDTAAIKLKTDNLPAAPASTTNITAGTITTTTNLTNAPTAGDLTAAMKASVTVAATAATPTAAAVTGAVGSVTGNVGGNVTGSVGSLGAQAKLDVNAEADTALADVGVTAAVTARIDVAVSTRLATAGYTVPPTVVQNRQEMDANSVALAAIFARTDVATSSRLATAGYTAPDNVNIAVAAAAAAAAAVSGAAIKLKTDSLNFTMAGVLDVNVLRVNGVVILGDGSVTPFHV